MMKIKSTLLVMCSLALLCGCSSSTQGDENIDSSVEEVSEVEAEIEEEDTDRIAILKFYDALDNAYYETEPGSGKKVSDVLRGLETPFEDFEGINVSENQYGDYVTKVLNSADYMFLKGFLGDSENGYATYDEQLMQAMYLQTFHKHLGSIMGITLPFEYEKQQSNGSENGGRLTYQEVKAQLNDCVNSLIKEGVPIQDFTTYYSYPESKESVYEIDNGTADYSVGINFTDLNSYTFGISARIHKNIADPYQITFKTETDEAIIYSTQITVIGWEDKWVDCQIFNNSFTDETNAEYEHIKKMFFENDSISILYDDNVEISLTKEDIENTRAWFAFFEIIRSYVE